MGNERKNIVTRVTKNGEYYFVEFDGSGFGLEAKYGVEPKLGDEVILHTVNGSMVRGVEINGSKVFYKTDADLENEHKEFVANLRKKREEEFLKNKDKLDADFDSLPKLFQEKIQKNRDSDPNYRIESESYDMFCYTQALEIAKNLPKFKDIPDIDVKERVKKFYEMSFEDQLKAIPTLNDGHSGNTFLVSCNLAAQYLSSAEYASNKIRALTNSQESELKTKSKNTI